MLLYDRVLEFASTFGSASMFAGVAIYELTSVMPLMENWREDIYRKVPKNPPSDYVWAEWTKHLPGHRPLKYGMLVAKMPPGLAAERIAALESHPDDSVYYGICFVENDSIICAGKKHHAACVIPISLVLSVSDDGLRWKTAYQYRPNLDILSAGINIPPVNLMAGSGSVTEQDWFQHSANYWPALFAFSLLNCRNIVTEENRPDERTQRRVIKSGKPPRTSYRILKVEVPKSVAARQSYGDSALDDTGPKVRLHLCSGHFRELRSDRFTNKKNQWVWVPAHFKGSESLGTVTTVRKLVPSRHAKPEGADS